MKKLLGIVVLGLWKLVSDYEPDSRTIFLIKTFRVFK